MKKILITGGAGFIGSHIVRCACAQGYRVLVLDNLTYAGDRTRLSGIKKVSFYRGDICDRSFVRKVFAREKPEYIIHAAAETHVDRSIHDSAPFLRTNIEGTRVLLDVCRQFPPSKFLHMATDEVYGEIRKGKFLETTPLDPHSPYAASKAAADLLIQSYVRTYGFPAVIVRPCNNYGPWQYPEKLIPVVTIKALRNEKIPVYGKGENMREWLFVEDCAHALLFVLRFGRVGEVYNMGSGQERRNLDVVSEILRLLGKPKTLIQFVQDRPGHDFRYALNFSKLSKLGFSPRVSFAEGLHKTVLWYQNNLAWVEQKMDDLSRHWKKTYKK